MNQTQSFVLVDPFEEQSILALNPRTFRMSKDALKSNDLEDIHQYMKSMALRSPEKHFEKAKSVVDGGLEFLKTMNSKADIKEKENPRAHRPSLSRRRAKFSLKPDISQSSTLLEPTLEVNALQNPEEFFAAFEKFENTKKELKRQRGEAVDEVKTSTTVRKRRPEIPRRKVTYKHYDYSSQSQVDTSVAKETLQNNVGSPPTQIPQQESPTPNRQCEEEEVTESLAKSENMAQKLFDELMASNIDKLDGNQALSFLKDRMNIKPLDIDDLQLPEFNEVPKFDLISPVKNLLQDSQSILSDTRVLPDVPKGKTAVPQKRLSDNIFQSLGSPTPPRSPFLAISTFGKRMLKSIVSKDPFSSHDIDSPPTTSDNIIGEGSTQASKDNEFPVSTTLHSLEKDKVTETALADMEDNRDYSMEERDVDDNATDIQRNADINGNVEDMLQKEASVTDVNLNDENISEENVEDVREKAGPSSLPEVNVEVSEVDDLSQPAQTDPNTIVDLDTSGPTQNPDVVTEQQNEEEEHPRTKSNKKKKIARKIVPKKTRQSLAGAGTSWTCGVRRSSRIKSKPLEFWKGEKLLYGRLHNSLPTIIGVKYIAPSKDGVFKVESFVSDKYKDLVEYTAMH